MVVFETQEGDEAEEEELSAASRGSLGNPGQAMFQPLPEIVRLALAASQNSEDRIGNSINLLLPLFNSTISSLPYLSRLRPFMLRHTNVPPL